MDRQKRLSFRAIFMFEPNRSSRLILRESKGYKDKSPGGAVPIGKASSTLFSGLINMLARSRVVVFGSTLQRIICRDNC